MVAILANVFSLLTRISRHPLTNITTNERHVLFGHHFTSIAGTGPIVGPAIGIIWGWVPAILWVLFGSIFMGAVHDLSALIMSLRHEGKSIADITAVVINKRIQKLFFLIVCLSLLIVIAIFGLVIAIIFKKFPQAVFPVWCEIPIAIALGAAIYKKKKNLKRYTFLAVLVMYLTVMFGHYIPITLPTLFHIPPTGLWTIILLIYAYIASTMPVTRLLQPRDYINAWQLYIALGILLCGIIGSFFVMDLTIPAPALRLNPPGAPPIMPFLFITIACGAISGFHSLICSGTSAKQLSTEADAHFIGYGSMLLEAALAPVIIVAVTAGIGIAYTTASGEVLTGIHAWESHYGSWLASKGLGSKLDAVVIGSSNLIATLGIPKDLGIIIIGVFIASFAGTTLDSATRVQRYVISEMVQNTPLAPLGNKWRATAIAVGSAAILAFSSGLNGNGALALWPMFGCINQLLAAITLLVATIYLKKRVTWGWLVTAIPAVIIISLTVWAAWLNQLHFWAEQNTLLWSLNGIILGLALWVIAEILLIIKKTSYQTIPSH